MEQKTKRLWIRLSPDEEALFRRKAAAAVVARDALGDHHHKPAHDEREVFLRTVVADGLLNFGKADDVHGHSAAEARHQAGKLQPLSLASSLMR